jgi:hypothetical protein
MLSCREIAFMISPGSLGKGVTFTYRVRLCRLVSEAGMEFSQERNWDYFPSTLNRRSFCSDDDCRNCTGNKERIGFHRAETEE